MLHNISSGISVPNRRGTAESTLASDVMESVPSTNCPEYFRSGSNKAIKASWWNRCIKGAPTDFLQSDPNI